MAASKKTDPEESGQDFLTHPLRWVKPRYVQDSQKVLVHVRGLTLVPYFSDHGDGWNHSGGYFAQIEAKRVLDPEGNLIGLQIGPYYVPEEFLDHPRVTAMVEEKPDELPAVTPNETDDSLAGKDEEQWQKECASS